ncbi:hypothetical protein KM043_008753 [Ampulex compressa]|nr:hypothetical protein KM043_008753 [Ampulex compressa]
MRSGLASSYHQWDRCNGVGFGVAKRPPWLKPNRSSFFLGRGKVEKTTGELQRGARKKTHRKKQAGREDEIVSRDASVVGSNLGRGTRANPNPAYPESNFESFESDPLAPFAELVLEGIPGGWRIPAPGFSEFSGRSWP